MILIRVWSTALAVDFFCYLTSSKNTHALWDLMNKSMVDRGSLEPWSCFLQAEITDINGKIDLSLFKGEIKKHAKFTTPEGVDGAIVPGHGLAFTLANIIKILKPVGIDTYVIPQELLRHLPDATEDPPQDMTEQEEKSLIDDISKLFFHTLQKICQASEVVEIPDNARQMLVGKISDSLAQLESDVSEFLTYCDPDDFGEPKVESKKEPESSVDVLTVEDFFKAAPLAEEETQDEEPSDDLSPEELREIWRKQRISIPKEGPLYSKSGFILDEEQAAAVREITSNKSRVYALTGQAGSGKSVVINFLRDFYQVKVTATTGKAAVAVGGVTVDTVFNFSRDKWKVRSQSYLAYIMGRLPEMIVIDEASMIGRQMGNLIYDIATQYDKRLVLVGDWAQASPVKDDWPTTSKLFEDVKWLYLTECHRQSDMDMIQALNDVRVGDVTDIVDKVFSTRIQKDAPEEDGWIRMFATNRMTDTYNIDRLEAYVRSTGEEKVTTKAEFVDLRDAQKKQDMPRYESYINNRLQNCRLAAGETISRGCQVVMTMNDPDRRWVNGDVAKVVEVWVKEGQNTVPIDKATVGFVTPTLAKLGIELDRTGLSTEVLPIEMEFEDAVGNVVDSVIGFPIKLGYALTIHKAQGMTVDRAWVDMSSIKHMQGDSKHGLAYVALSRTRTLDGLLISSWSPDVIHCSKQLTPFIAIPT